MPDVNMSEGRPSQSRLREILQTERVDVGNGTLFGVANRREVAHDRLMIVISTGGSGKSAIDEAMRIADQKLKEEYKTFVKFIVVDSATRELAPFEQMDRSVVRPLNISVPGAKDRFKPENRNSFFKEIMPADYDVAGKLGDDGASQDRMTGRIKLYDSRDGEGNDARLSNLIKEIFNTDWVDHSEKPVDIILLSGISGGNGSGTFLDLAVIAKNACPDPARTKVYGYLMLPDTAEGFATGDQARGTLYRNGFAALKELESYMSLVFEPERKEKFPSTHVGEEIEVSSLNLPIDYPILISGKYEDAVSMIGETIVNLIADSEGQFDQRSFYANLTVMRLQALSAASMSDLGILKAGACPEDSHMYCGIGYAHASIPEKIVIPNVIGKVCRKLCVNETYSVAEIGGISDAFCSLDKPLTKMEFEDGMQILFGLEGGLSSQSLWEKLDGVMQQYGRLDENEFVVTKSDIMADNVQQYLDGFKVKEKSQDAAKDMVVELKRLEAEFRTNAQKVMSLYGPRAMQFLYDGTGYTTQDGGNEDLTHISIRTMLETVQVELQNRASKPGEYPPRVERKGLLREIIEFFTHGDVNTWMGQAADAAQDDVFCELAKTFLGGTWRQEYELKVCAFVKSCIRFADILDVMTDHYEGAGKVMDQGYEKFSSETGEKNGINLCQSEKMYKWVKEKVDQKIAQVNLKTVKDALIDDFMKHMADWGSDSDGKARKRYDEVMSQTCSVGKYATVAGGLHLSVSDYFTEILKDVQDVNEQATKIRNELAGIVGRLRQASAPSLNVEKSDGIHINETILVPKQLFTGPMGQIIQSQFVSVVGQHSKIYPSSVVDAIICYQTSVANPISGLKDLTRWENGYERNFGRPASATCHSCNGEFVSQYTELTGTQTDAETGLGLIPGSVSAEEDMLSGTGLCWQHYPSVNTKIYWNDFDKAATTVIGKTAESAYRAEVFNKKIEDALREGLIECVRNGNEYAYFINLIPEDWTNLSAANYVADESVLERGKFRRGRKLFEYLAAQNPHTLYEWRLPVKLTSSEFFEQPFDFTEILNKEHWKPERVSTTHKTYMKRIMRKNIYLYRRLEETLYRYDGIRRTLEEGEIKYREQYQMDLFIELFTYGLIYADAKEQVWNIRINEQGANKPLIVFDAKLKPMLRGIEQGVYADKLNLTLVYRRYAGLAAKGEIDLEELDRVKTELIDSMSEEEFVELRDRNLERLSRHYQVYVDSYGNEKDSEKAMADAWKLRGTERAEAEEINKLYWEIRKALEDAGTLDAPEHQEEEPQKNNAASGTGAGAAGTSGWECPKCGAHHEDSVKFCPNDGTPKPKKQEGWECPKCGAHHEDSVKFCPNDGTPKPRKQEGWICPKCGAHHENSVKFCPNDGTPKPESQETPEPPQEPTEWICPACGTHHALDVRFCPNDGTPQPKKAGEPTEWICPNCGTHHALGVAFCPNDGTKRP